MRANHPINVKQAQDYKARVQARNQKAAANKAAQAKSGPAVSLQKKLSTPL